MNRISYKDIQMEYLTAEDSVDQVNVLNSFVDMGVSKFTFRRAAMDLGGKDPERAGPMIEWVHQKFGLMNGERGPSLPEVGDNNHYSVQEFNGKLFIRLPVHTLGLDKQDEVNVVFGSDEVRVRAGS